MTDLAAPGTLTVEPDVPPARMAARDLFAEARWRFAPPTTGPDAGRDYWSVRIPSVFTAGTAAKATGHWQNFVPGPRHPVPWATQEELANAADALPDSGIFPMTPALQLLTPLNAG